MKCTDVLEMRRSRTRGLETMQGHVAAGHDKLMPGVMCVSESALPQ